MNYREWAILGLTKPGKSQGGLAKHLGLDPAQVTRMLTAKGKPRRIQADELAKIAEYLNEPLPAHEEPITAKPEAISGTRPPPQFFDERDTMPVYAAAEGGKGHLIISQDEIDRIPRPHTLKGIRGAYGVLITGESMVPAYRPGDIAWVNPILPPIWGSDVILFHVQENGDREALIKYLTGISSKEWAVEQWNPAKKFKLSKTEWPDCHAVVGCFRRR